MQIKMISNQIKPLQVFKLEIKKIIDDRFYTLRQYLQKIKHKKDESKSLEISKIG
jgi:hypothetical protein